MATSPLPSLRPSLFLLRRSLYLLRLSHYLLRPSHYLLGPSLYLLRPSLYLLRLLTVSSVAAVEEVIEAEAAAGGLAIVSKLSK